MTPHTAPNTQDLAKLEEEFDPEIRFRPLLPVAGFIVAVLLFALSLFHYYTAGFGLLRETTHRAIHLSFVLGLIFLVFSAWGRNKDEQKSTLLAPGGISALDWLFAAAAVLACMYVPWIFNDLAFRVGNPLPEDVVMGTVMIVVLLEATRRSNGIALPIIAVALMLYAYFGPSMPGILKHPGATWSGIVNHLYLTSQGVYGVALGVVATYVFHYVLFGVLATRIGLGKLFIDLASYVAGRYVGGPAKVSIFGSALFGMISGSSIANTVTVGSLTIPAMIRLGYPKHFAAAVESTASTGGQITPPIMGAAAFLMIEFLGVSYTSIILAAIVPAFMHFFGVFCQVHFEAKRNNMQGMRAEDIPNPRDVIAQGWQTATPLALLLAILFSGYTPYLAAFWGITGCMVVGLLRDRLITSAFTVTVLAATWLGFLTTSWFVVLAGLFLLAIFALSFFRGDEGRARMIDIADAFVVGAKYAIAVGAAAAAVGIIVGVITLTGVGFKISWLVTTVAADIGKLFLAIAPGDWLTLKELTLFFTLILTAIVCILLGTGVPTTATYIIMVTVAAPTLGLLGVEAIVAHFFVFYYGVLADITPPVALAAYAGASMAGADPFKTGNTAFRLALGKILVPFVFVYGPAMLIVTKGFTWYDFIVTTFGCAVGIVMLSGAFAGFMVTRLSGWQRWLVGIAALPTIAPGLPSTLAGLAIALPVLIPQILALRETKQTA